MSKILVTGGAGFIGSHIVDYHINHGDKVVVIDNLSNGKKINVNPQAKFYKADIRNKWGISQIFTKEKPEILNHHAAQIDLRKSLTNPVLDMEVNLLGFLNLLEAGIKNNLKKVIFASSAAIYGETRILPTPEDYEPKQPFSPYGISKLTAEHFLNYYHKKYGLPFTVLRYANVYGPRQDPFGEGGVVAIFSRKLLKKETPIINGDGRQTRDFVYVGDVVEANVAALKKDINRAVNIGTGKETSVNNLLHLLTGLTGMVCSEKHVPTKPGEQRRSAVDPNLAQKLLGWQAKVSLSLGLKQTVKFFQK